MSENDKERDTKPQGAGGSAGDGPKGPDESKPEEKDPSVLEAARQSDIKPAAGPVPPSTAQTPNPDLSAKAGGPAAPRTPDERTAGGPGPSAEKVEKPATPAGAAQEGSPGPAPRPQKPAAPAAGSPGEAAAAPPTPPRPARPAPAAAGAEGPAAGAGAGDAAAAPRAPRAPAGPSPAELAQRAEVPSNALRRLRETFPDIAAAATFFAGAPIVPVPLDRIYEVCRFLKTDPVADCKYLSNLHGNHNPDNPKPLEVIYNLYSITSAQWIELKVELAENEEIPTVSTIWKTANWHEREAYDMLGIRFAGHPDLTRILLPDEWVGHPLRKEYPLEGKEGDHRLYR